MFLDEEYLRNDNDLFIFDRCETRLFRIEQGMRNEVTDRVLIALIVTSPAKVLAYEQARLCEHMLASSIDA